METEFKDPRACRIEECLNYNFRDLFTFKRFQDIYARKIRLFENFLPF